MFIYGDLVVERQIYKSGATSKVYMFIQPISVDPTHCIVYDIQNNRLWHEEPVYVDVEWSTLEIYMNGTWILYQLPLSEEYYG